MVNSDHIQKQLNDLLDNGDDGSEDDVFLAEDLHAGQTIVPQPQKNEPIIQPTKKEEEPAPLYEREMADLLPPEPVEVDKVKTAEGGDLPEEKLTKELPDRAEEAINTTEQAADKEQKEERSEETNKAKDFVRSSFNFLDKSQGELNEKIKAIENERKENGIKMQAMNLGLGYINLKGLPIMPEVLKLIDEEEAKKARIICFLYRKGEEIRLATSEMTAAVEQTVGNLQAEYPEVRIGVYLTSEESMEAALKLYSSLPRRVARINDIEVLEKEIADSSLEMEDIKEVQDKVGQASTTEILGILVMAATRIEASDIHIEAEEEGVKVRFRIDGVLHDVAMLRKEAWSNLVARIKLNAGLKINIQDRPQDGNFTLNVQGKSIDFRVSMLPTNYGESVVIRILFHDKIRKMNLNNL
ncbi:MAG TPA: ATPase, T2SS/T4P/T4SS family, partial [Patescibacteria group bacterium]|nr:ATPase, T2SS/T4P/T4SS family [Patescibacteria group bacterium]